MLLSSPRYAFPPGNKYRAYLFIDGNNFYHNCKQSGLIPKNIDFTKLCLYICKKLNCNWVLTYYYNSIPDIRDGQDTYHKHMKFLNELKTKDKFVVKTRKLQKMSTEEIKEEKRQDIDNFGFCEKCRQKAAANCFSCIGDFTKKEKGIDVMIAVDMIENALKEKYNCCVLISGDADFIPAIELIKQNKKEAITCSVRKGFANELLETQKCSILKKSEIEKNCYA